MQCELVKQIYSNPNNGWTVVVLSTLEASVPDDARQVHKGSGIHFKAVGTNLPEKKGMQLEVEGSWVKSDYGRQMKVQAFREIMPVTEAGIQSYLTTSIKGIGPVNAKLIVGRFGVKTLEVMEHEPHRLLEIKGIGRDKLQDIVYTFQATKTYRDLLTFLTPFGVSGNKVQKIQDTYGLRSMEIVRKDPYKMCEVHGFGFLTVDRIALSVSCRHDDPKRIRGAIQYALDKAGEDGHLFLPKDDLVKASREVLNHEQEDFVEDTQIKSGINLLVQSGALVYEDGCLYLSNTYREELQTAEAVTGMLLRQRKVLQVDDIIEAGAKDLGIILTPKLLEAVRMCLNETICLLTGGPGTGKTTALRLLLHVYEKAVGGKVLAVAPTGRASRRITETTQHPAATIHSTYGIIAQKDFTYIANTEDVDCDLLIADESSMIDSMMFHQMVTRLPKGAQMVIVGDEAQLPSVGPGRVLRDLLECGLVPTTTLDIVHRQGADSFIHINAQSIRKFRTSLEYNDTDFVFVSARDASDAAEAIQALYQNLVGLHGVENVQVLSPYKSSGAASSMQLNDALQELANPPAVNPLQIKRGKTVFRKGDKVIQTRNFANLSNGDIGYVSTVNKQDLKHPLLHVSFSGDRFAQYETGDLDMLELAYALTIHKSQGSEYAITIIPVLFSFYKMLHNDLIYTAITRAKQKVVLVGDKRALHHAIKTQPAPRNTRLAKRINAAYGRAQRPTAA